MKKIVAVCLCLLFLVQSAPDIFAAEVAEEQENTGNAGESEEDVRGENAGENEEDVRGESGLEISAPSAILMEASTGQVVYEKNPDEERPPASVTKIMTLLLIFGMVSIYMQATDFQVVILSHLKYFLYGKIQQNKGLLLPKTV